MATLPHDLTDLSLAPLVLQLDRQLASYTALNAEEIHLRVSLEVDADPRFAPARRECLLDALTRHLDVHGWELSWTTRGLRLHHEARTVTLGVPPSLAAYLDLR
jgi:hypothetical protein